MLTAIIPKIQIMKTKDQLIDDLLTLAFAEDVGDGDATTLSTIPADETGTQQLIVKERSEEHTSELQSP